jgi:O-methyltransferase
MSFKQLLKSSGKRILLHLGMDVKLTGIPNAHKNIPDAEYYKPNFSPWLGYGEFSAFFEKGRQLSMVSPDRCWVLYCLLTQSLTLPGNIWECGVYKGGTAAMFAEIIRKKGVASNKRLRLFDTFEGMPATNAAFDYHHEGGFSDTSLEAVLKAVGEDPWVVYHKGFIPSTFEGLENEEIAFAHIDVDIYKSYIDCCAFIYPRLCAGGFMVFDDYGFPSCPGARKAVDVFFQDTQSVPLALPSGQAVVFKSR